MKLIAIALAAITLLGQTPLKSVRNEKLASSFYSGRLPDPILTPEGRPDEVAATLAKQVAGGLAGGGMISLERTTELSGQSQSSGSVAVFMTPDGHYNVNYQVPTISVEGYHVTS